MKRINLQMKFKINSMQIHIQIVYKGSETQGHQFSLHKIYYIYIFRKREYLKKKKKALVNNLHEQCS